HAGLQRYPLLAWMAYAPGHIRAQHPATREGHRRRYRPAQVSRRIALHLEEVADVVPVRRPLVLGHGAVALAVADQRFFHLVDYVPPRDSPPQIPVLAEALSRIEAADVEEYGFADDDGGRRHAPALMADGLGVRPSFGDPPAADGLVAVSVEFDVIGRDHIG